MKAITIDKVLFREMYDNGKTDVEISKVFKCTASKIYLLRKSQGLPTKFTYKSRLDIQKVKELVIKGLSDYKIAEILKCDHATVHDFRKKNDIYRDSLVESTPVPLTDRQVSIIVGHIFGDGHLKSFKGSISGTISQGEKQKEYAEWKYLELRSLCTQLVRRERKTADKRNGRFYISYDAHISTNSELTWLYNNFYQDRLKVISDFILSFYDELSLAVHFMDDGCKGSQGGYSLATNSFTREDCLKFCKFLMDRFGIYASLHTANVVYIYKGSAQKFAEIINPYLIPSMQYKLHCSHVTP